MISVSGNLDKNRHSLINCQKNRNILTFQNYIEMPPTRYLAKIICTPLYALRFRLQQPALQR